MYNAKNRKSNGFVMLYTIIIGSICAISALTCFNMQVLKRDSNISLSCAVEKQDLTQRDREYLLTNLNEYIESNCSKPFDEETIKLLFAEQEDFMVSYESSSLEYSEIKDAFYISYYYDGKFYKEELCGYKTTENSVEFYISGFSYKKGVL